MKRKIFGILFALVLAVALLLAMVPMGVLADDDADLTITSPGTYSGLTVVGDLYVQASNVRIMDSTVHGDIYVSGASVITSVAISDCTIAGNIEVRNATIVDIGSRYTSPPSGNTIGGNVEIYSPAHDVWVYDNLSIDNIEAEDASYVVVFDNTIAGNIELTGCVDPRHPGPYGEDIWGNIVDGNIEIKDSDGYVVGSNTVNGEVEVE